MVFSFMYCIAIITQATILRHSESVLRKKLDFLSVESFSAKNEYERILLAFKANILSKKSNGNLARKKKSFYFFVRDGFLE